MVLDELHQLGEIEHLSDRLSQLLTVLCVVEVVEELDAVSDILHTLTPELLLRGNIQ